VDEEDACQQEYRLIIWLPPEAQTWHAQIRQGEDVVEFASPLELVDWLEGQLEPPRGGLR